MSVKAKRVALSASGGSSTVLVSFGDRHEPLAVEPIDYPLGSLK